MTETTEPSALPFPKPIINDDVAFLYEGFAKSELRLQHCQDCNTLRMPPGPACPECLSLNWSTMKASGRGRVHSFTVHHHPPIAPWEAPHAVVLVDLDEGVRFLASFAGDANDLVIGLPVEIEFRELEDDYIFPVFSLSKNDNSAEAS